jgi:DNA-binding transcriptional MerR regulator
MSRPGAVAGAPRAEDPEERPLRIGDVARMAGTTTRTIRYYEEIGLLANVPGRNHGGHRLYSEAEVDRLREVMRLRSLLGVSLDELKTLLAAEDARAAVRAQLQRDDVDATRRRELLNQALGHIDRQLELVTNRSLELGKLQDELSETRRRVKRKLRDLDAPSGPAGTGTEVTGDRPQRVPATASDR